MDYGLWYHAGRTLGEIIKGVNEAAASSPNAAALSSSYPNSANPDLEPIDEARIADSNPGALLRPGNLLVTYQADKSCYQIDPNSGRMEFLFTIDRRQGLFIWRAIADVY